jgi:probable rRNA maturation factor
MSRRWPEMIEVDLFIEDARFVGAGAETGVDWQALGERATQAALAETPFAELYTAGLYDLSVRLSDDATVHQLNLETRGFDKPTNILSYQYIEAPTVEILRALDGATLGDLVLAYETIAQEAKAAGKSFDAHVSHLIVHGVLHLLGYDHLDDNQAEAMEAIERRALATLGIADPYKWHPIDDLTDD